METVIGAAIALMTLGLKAIADRAGARADARAKAIDLAGEQVADWVRLVWDKGENGYTNLLAYLERLRVPLHRAGVPISDYTTFRQAALAMWSNLEYVDDQIGYSSSTDKYRKVIDAVDAIYGALQSRPSWWRRILA